jgi:hypothetical protein
MKITDKMIAAITPGLAPSIEAVRKARGVLAEAGMTGVELHPLEIEAVTHYRERERSARHQVEYYLALGPLPDHTCLVGSESGLVKAPRSCPFGCRFDQPRIEVS